MKGLWLALGSNVGDREEHLREAISRLRSADLKIERISPVYETAPQGYVEQDWFLNLVIAAQTSLTPMQLIAHCKRVERTMKRQRTVINGPRTIDIDVLFYGNSVIDRARLKVPHPRYRKRRFVLQPLADLEPDFRDPVTHLTVKEMLMGVMDQAIRATGIVIAAEQLS